MIDRLGMHKERIQPIVGSERFGLTEADVVQTTAELRLEIASIRDIMGDPDKRLRRFARNSLPQKEKELRLFTSHTSTETLETVRGIYRKVTTDERAGKRKESIITGIRSEFPNVLDYYWLLQKKTWGYNLGQGIIAAVEAEELRDRIPS
ncbi:MAG: hypothetical protein Q8Q13_00070 [bacterium]|nr:hypothetical protein [bacterium]